MQILNEQKSRWLKSRVLIIDADAQGTSGQSVEDRPALQRSLDEISLGHFGTMSTPNQFAIGLMIIKIAATFSAAVAPNESIHPSKASEDNQTVNSREHLEVWIADAIGTDLLTHE